MMNIDIRPAQDREKAYGLNKSRVHRTKGEPTYDDEHCRMCETHAQMVIIKDELWGLGDMVLCFDCIEKFVLKRPMRIEDLKPNVPVNLPYFRGFIMSKQLHSIKGTING